MSTIAYTIHFTFIILSAKIFIDLLGFKPLTFGYLMFVYGGIYFMNGLLTTYLSKRIGSIYLINIGTVCIGLNGVLMISMIHAISVTSILLPISIATLGITIIRSVATTNALAEIPNHAGQGAAGLNLVQFILSALIASVITDMQHSPQLLLGILALTGAVLILILNYLANKQLINRNMFQTSFS